MLDFIMKLLGYENIKKINIPKEYKFIRAEKLTYKAVFYKKTNKFMDNVIVNSENVLLDGFSTYVLCKWEEIKYIKVIRINETLDGYLETYKKYNRQNHSRRK